MQVFKTKQIITFNNAKTTKGEKITDKKSGLPYKTGIIYLSPYKNNSKGKNLCSHASKGCAESCLVGAGFGGIYEAVMQGRINKTEYFLSDRIGFMNQLRNEITKWIRLNEGKYKLIIRLNGTSDLPYEDIRIFEDNKNIFEIFNKVQFYDYTKNHNRFDKTLPKNYHLTFSRSECNEDKAIELLNRGFNAAFVFTKTPIKYKGFKVVNGDESDLAFKHKVRKGSKGVIVGLYYKQITKKGFDNSKAVKSGFVINTSTIENTMNKLDKVYSKIKSKKSLEVSK
jgi:hypothetical protein